MQSLFPERTVVTGIPTMKGTDSISNNGGTRVPTYTAVTKTIKASRAFVAAENILLRETLARVLSRCSDIEVAGVGSVNS